MKIIEQMKEMTFPSLSTFPKPDVNEEACNGCGRCVETCPIQLLMLNENDKCTANNRYDHFRCILCQNCMAVCPNDAILIKGEYRVHTGFWKNDDLYPDQKSYPNPFMSDRVPPFDILEDQITEVEKTIYKRRSIRLYKTKQVPRKLVHRVLEAARYAPSAGNNQPWKFIVIQSRELIDELERQIKAGCRKYTKLMLPEAWRDKKVPGEQKIKLSSLQKVTIPLLVKYKPTECDQRVRGGVNAVGSDPEYRAFFNAPTVILQLMDKRAIGGIEYDAGICGQNMVLAAHALGLATCYVGLAKVFQRDPEFKREILKMDDRFEIVMGFSLGYPKGRIDTAVEREALRVDWIE